MGSGEEPFFRSESLRETPTGAFVPARCASLRRVPSFKAPPHLLPKKVKSAALVGKGLKQQMLDALIFSLAAYEPTPERVLEVLRCSYDFPIGALELVNLEGLGAPGPQPLFCGRSTNGEVVVACRGTADLKDLVVDLQFIKRRLPFATGAAHLGFVHRAASVDCSVFVKLLEEGESIIFTGHSLGGAVASLLTLKVLEEGRQRGLCPHRRHCQAITFGAPLFADAGLAELINDEYRELFHHVVSKRDIVPKILPLVAAGHRLLGGNPHHLELLRLGRLGLDLFQFVTKIPIGSAIYAAENKVPAAMRSILWGAVRLLWPGNAEHQYAFAGQIVMLDRGEEVVDRAVSLTKAEELNFWTAQLGFGLLFHPRAFIEHGLWSYYAALAKGIPARLLERLQAGTTAAGVEGGAAAAASCSQEGAGEGERKDSEEGDMSAAVKAVHLESMEGGYSQLMRQLSEKLSATQVGRIDSINEEAEEEPSSSGVSGRRLTGGGLGSASGRYHFGEAITEEVSHPSETSSQEDTDAEDDGVLGATGAFLSPRRRCALAVDCPQCRALQIFAIGQEVVPNGQALGAKRRKFRMGWLLVTATVTVSRHIRRFNKVAITLAVVRFAISNPFF